MGHELARQITPILAPSTNTTPLLGPDDHHDKNAADKKHKKKTVDVSKHTFYVENSQMRLKLYARNEVCGVNTRNVSLLNDCCLTFAASNAAIYSCVREGCSGITLYGRE